MNDGSITIGKIVHTRLLKIRHVGGWKGVGTIALRCASTSNICRCPEVMSGMRTRPVLVEVEFSTEGQAHIIHTEAGLVWMSSLKSDGGIVNAIGGV